MKAKRNAMLKGVAAAVLGTMALSAQAITFNVTSQLLGDPRPANPDGLVVDVSVAVVDDEATFTVSLAGMSGVHNNVKLDEFYWSLVGPASQYSVSEANPAWIFSTPATVVGGGNNTGFMFEEADPAGSSMLQEARPLLAEAFEVP